MNTLPNGTIADGAPRSLANGPTSRQSGGGYGPIPLPLRVKTYKVPADMPQIKGPLVHVIQNAKGEDWICQNGLSLEEAESLCHVANHYPAAIEALQNLMDYLESEDSDMSKLNMNLARQAINHATAGSKETK